MTTTRDRSVSVSFATSGQWWNTTSNSGSGVWRTTRVLTTKRTRTGERVPHWHDVIAKGGNATSAMSAYWDAADITSFGEGGFYWRSSYDGSLGWCKLTGDPVGSNDQMVFSPYEPQVDTSFVDNLARANFYKRLHSMRTQFQVYTFAGELRETLHMLRKPAAALWDSARDYLRALKKGKRRNPKHWIKDASGLWLEHSFGWMPLIQDVKSAYSAYATLTKPRQPTQQISAGAQKEFDRSAELNGQLIYDGPRLTQGAVFMYLRRRALLENQIVRYKGAVRASVEATRWDNFELFGFNPKEFIPTAWELLPWSFLVDYFTNVGDILNASITRTSDLSYVNKTIIQETDFNGELVVDKTRNPVSSFVSATASLGSQGQAFSFTRRRVVRQPNSGVAMPTLQLNFSLSDGQLGNIAALLGQANALHSQKPFRR